MFPSRGRLTIRAYRPLTCSEAATLRAVPFPRIVIPSEVEGSLLHCRHMHACALTQTIPWCFPLFSLTHVLPVCKKDFSASALMTRKKDDSLTSSFIPLRRVVPLRGTLSCAFGAALLQGPTRIIGVTGDLRLKSHFRVSPFIKNRRKASLRLGLPHRGRGLRQRRSGTLINDVLETLLPTYFHNASALSVLSGPFPSRGRLTIRGYHRLKNRRNRYRYFVFSSC